MLIKSMLAVLVYQSATATAALTFQEVILDPTYIAYERDVGDIDGDGRNDVVAVMEGDTTVQVFRAPTWIRSTLVTFQGAQQYPRAGVIRDWTMITIIERTRAHGFAFAQVMLLGVSDGSQPNVYGEKPWRDDDPHTPNGGYFKNFDAVRLNASNR